MPKVDAEYLARNGEKYDPLRNSAGGGACGTSGPLADHPPRLSFLPQAPPSRAWLPLDVPMPGSPGRRARGSGRSSGRRRRFGRKKNQRKFLTRFAIEARRARPPSLKMPFVRAHRGLPGDLLRSSRFISSRPLLVQPGASHEARKPGVYTPQIELGGPSLDLEKEELHHEREIHGVLPEARGALHRGA
jgi:hypothetical protein